MLFVPNSPIIQNLSILICHLFIGGEFHVANVLHDSNDLPNRLLNEINSHCLNDIAWTIDSRTPQWNRNLTKDHILQIIPMEHNQYPYDRLEQFPAYYRLFILNKVSNRKMSSVLNTTTNSVALLHDPDSDSIEAFLLNDDFTFYDQSIKVHNEISNQTSKNVFDKIFGKRENMRKLGVFTRLVACNGSSPQLTADNNRRLFLANFFFTQMNMTFIEMLPPWCGGNTPLPSIFYRHIRRRIYNELSWDLEQIGIETA